MSRGDLRYSYAGDPSATPSDAVRFLVGDTNPNRPLLDDREVAWAIAENPNQNIAAAVLAEHLFGKFAAQADISVGPVSKSYSKVAELFKKKADQLRSEACKFAIASFPATKIASKDALDDDQTLTRPAFSVGLGDNVFAQQINDDLQGTRFNGFGY